MLVTINALITLALFTLGINMRCGHNNHQQTALKYRCQCTQKAVLRSDLSDLYQQTKLQAPTCACATTTGRGFVFPGGCPPGNGGSPKMHGNTLCKQGHSLTDIHVHTHCNQKICLQTDIKVLMSLGFFYCFTLYNLNSNTRELDLWRLTFWVCVLASFVLKTFICTAEIQGCVAEISSSICNVDLFDLLKRSAHSIMEYTDVKIMITSYPGV